MEKEKNTEINNQDFLEDNSLTSDPVNNIDNISLNKPDETPEWKEPTKAGYIKDPAKYNDKLWNSSWGTKDLSEETPIRFQLAHDFKPNVASDNESIELKLAEEKIIEFFNSDKSTQDFLKLGRMPKKNEILFFWQMIRENLTEIDVIESFYVMSNYFGINDKRFYKFLSEESQQEILESLKKRGAI